MTVSQPKLRNLADAAEESGKEGVAQVLRTAADELDRLGRQLLAARLLGVAFEAYATTLDAPGVASLKECLRAEFTSKAES